MGLAEGIEPPTRALQERRSGLLSYASPNDGCPGRIRTCAYWFRASRPTARRPGIGWEVGYVGRDVESIIRDLMELAVNMAKEKERKSVEIRARAGAFTSGWRNPAPLTGYATRTMMCSSWCSASGSGPALKRSVDAEIRRQCQRHFRCHNSGD